MKTSLTHIIKGENRISEILRFVLTGGTAVIVQYGIYLSFISIFNIPPSIATLISYTISFCLNYYLSNVFTFHSNLTKKKAILFTICHVINISLQSIFVVLFSKMMADTYALFPAICICMPINYLMVRQVLKKS